MKLLKTLLVIFTLLINLLIIQPSWADPPRLTPEVDRAINELIQAKITPEQTEYTPEQIEQKIGDLKTSKFGIALA
jgi:hypothetical protein